MIITRLLTYNEYQSYADWLKSQSKETISLYFGNPYSDYLIDKLVAKIVSEPSKHEFVVAEDHGRRVGVVHIAISGSEVELGIIVLPEYRGKKIGSMLIEEAILWARNRNYNSLYMHCLSWNQPIRHLCKKHDLAMTNMYGESEVKVTLPPADLSTIIAETKIRNRQIWHMFLENMRILD
jgi:GNAT superfamily N-acetyltransferase